MSNYNTFNHPPQGYPYGGPLRPVTYSYPEAPHQQRFVPNLPRQQQQQPQHQQQQPPPPPQQSQQPQQQPVSQQPNRAQFFPSLPQGASVEQFRAHTPQRPTSTTSRPRNGRVVPPPAPPVAGNASTGHEADSPSIEEQILSELRRGQPGEAEGPPAARPGPGRHDDGGADDDDDDDDVDAEADDQDVDPSDPVYNLPPPPENIYPNFVELEKAVHAWSANHGYDLVSRHTKRNAAGLFYKRSYVCSKHGQRKSKGRGENKIRARRRSVRIGCPMCLHAVACDTSDPTGDWTVKVRVAHHNHPAEDAVKLIGHRRRARTGAIEEAVDGLLAINTSLPDIHKFLEVTHPDGLITKADVSNMKMRWLKHGTCSGRENSRYNRPTCVPCRTAGMPCNGARPACERCFATKTACVYDNGGAPHSLSARPPDDSPAAVGPGGDAGTADGTRAAPPNGFNPEQFQAVMARLRAAAEPAAPTARLTLESSEVEYLATATCGSGASYRDIPFLMTASDPAAWAAYSRAFLTAARAENTYEVLLGLKPAPPPLAALPATAPVREHNELVKQTAIYARRNAALVAAMLGTLGPALRAQLARIDARAAGASSAPDMWRALEHACAPRGSETAYARYLALMGTSLQACEGGLAEYIAVMEERWSAFRGEHEGRASGRAAVGDGPASSTEEAFICFHFLASLGPEHRRLVDNVCRKNNVGGSGSGTPLSFKALTELVKGAMQWQAGMQDE